MSKEILMFGDVKTEKKKITAIKVLFLIGCRY